MTPQTIYDFAADLAARIIQYARIPKLQVERIVGPILTIFLEEIINQLLDFSIDGPDAIRLIAPEWPIKKERNHQSTNIDWLMIQPGKRRLFLVELKTDTGSSNPRQLKIYQRVTKLIRQDSARYLLTNAERIRDKSKHKWKYNVLLKCAEPYREQLNQIREAKIIYIVPSRMKKDLKEAGIRVYGLNELPHELRGPKHEVWRTLRSALGALESSRRNTPRANPALAKTSQGAPDYGAFARQIETRLRRGSPGLTPVNIWFGIKGSGSFPNYQIEFANGSIVPYRNSGKRYLGVERFADTNLDGPFEWKTLLGTK